MKNLLSKQKEKNKKKLFNLTWCKGKIMKVQVMKMLQVLNRRKPSLLEREKDPEMKWMTWEAQTKTTEKMKIVKRVTILPNFQVKLKWKEIWLLLLKKSLENKIPLEEKTKISKSKSLQLILPLNNMTNNQMFKWMSINILTLLQMFIKSESIWKRPKIGTIKWLLNSKPSLMKSKLNVTKLNNNSKNLREV